MPVQNHENRIQVGQNPGSQYCGYGDDSVHRSSLVFAFTILSRETIVGAEAKLMDIKGKFRIPHEYWIHCRELFSGDQRKRGGLAHFSPGNVKDLISSIVYEMGKLGAVCHVGFAKRPEGELLIKESEHFPQLVNADKVILGILANTCFSRQPNAYIPIDMKDVEFWVDKDKTMVEWFGKHSRSDKLTAGLSVVNAPEGKSFYFLPHIVEHRQVPLLQVADVFAFIGSHAVEEDRAGTPGWFSKRLQEVKYSYSEFVP